MRKKFVQFAAVLLAVCLMPVIPAHAVGEETTIRVGLFYGGNALPGANLQNSVGTGYQFGCLNGNSFVWLGETEETKISMVKTQNVYYTDSLPGGGYGYSDQITSSTVVGCYHLRLPGAYASFDAASLTAGMMPDGFPAWISGEYQVRVGAYATKEEAEQAKAVLGLDSAEVVGTSSYGVTVVTTGTAQPLFQFDAGEANAPLVVRPGLESGVKAVTHFKGLTYYGDFSYERISGGNLTVVNRVSLEDYVRGILPYEMSPSWPLEALKAQAVCARSYTMNHLNKHSSYHFDMCNTTDCQVYYGTSSANETTERAVVETMGEYAWYDGKIAETLYHASDGGATENSENVYTTAIPYLRGVIDPYEALVADKIPGYHWTRTAAELRTQLNNNGYQCGEIADLSIQTTPTGNVYSLTVTDINGKSWTFTRDKARTILGGDVKSQRYTVSSGSGSVSSGGVGNSGVVNGGSVVSGSKYSVAGGGTLDGMAGAWTIDGDGFMTQIGTDGVYAITGNGVERVESQTGTQVGTGTSTSTGTSIGTGTSVTASGNGLVISGTGNGHNVGMSQWGAYAMAQQGYTYRDILTFYFTGIEIHT